MAREAKPHISLRVESDTAERVMALKQSGETTTAVYNRVLAAGVEALTATPEPDAQAADAALVAALQKSVDTLTAQLDVKDEQIRNLGDNLRAAQMLHAQAAQYPSLEAVNTPQGGGEHAQDVHAAQERTQAEHAQEPRRRGGIAGAIGRIIWGR